MSADDLAWHLAGPGLLELRDEGGRVHGRLRRRPEGATSAVWWRIEIGGRLVDATKPGVDAAILQAAEMRSGRSG